MSAISDVFKRPEHLVRLGILCEWGPATIADALVKNYGMSEQAANDLAAKEIREQQERDISDEHCEALDDAAKQQEWRE